MIITTSTLGSLMIKTGIIGLAGLWLTSLNADCEYVLDCQTVKNIVNSILPSEIHLFFIENKSDLEATLSMLSSSWDLNRLYHVENEYHVPETCGLTFIGSNAAIIYVNHIRDLFEDIYEATEKLYNTVFHEIYHILLNTEDEELVTRKARELYGLHKDTLPFPFVHYSEVDT